MSAVGGACCGAAPRAEEAEPPASAHAAGGAATAAQAGGRAQAQGGAGAVAASAGPLEALEAGGVMAHWTGSLDKSVFELRVENPHARDRAASFAALSSASLFSQIPVADKKRLIADVIAQCPRHPVAKAMGSLVALAAGDATGHWFEFMDACDKPAVNRGATVFDVSKLEFVPATHDPERSHGGCFSGDIFNKFQLQMGQWTDDCSMGLAMADSLLVKRRYGAKHALLSHLYQHVSYLPSQGRDQYRKELRKRAFFGSQTAPTSASASGTGGTRATATPSTRTRASACAPPSALAVISPSRSTA